MQGMTKPQVVQLENGEHVMIGTIPQLFPINKQLHDKLVDMGMEHWQAIMYILGFSVIFDVEQ